MATYDVVIIGTGPYGLSVAAHLRCIAGLDLMAFGEPMSFWERHMPAGMLLRSPWAGSCISDPQGVLTLDAYRVASSNHMAVPIPVERFVEYGRWFQQQAIPAVDRRRVVQVDADRKCFRVTLEDGECVRARRVVIAAGIAPFAWIPKPLRGLSTTLVSHTSAHRELRRFAGKRLVVIGGGQSALESAVLLRESGAWVEVILRGPGIRWLHKKPWLHKWPIEPLLYAPPDVGTALVSHLVARPHWFRCLSRQWQDRLGARSVRPAGAQWLKPRLRDTSVLTGREVISATPRPAGVHLQLDDGSKRDVDHVLLGTGYRVDISRYKFLTQPLLAAICRTDGYPELDRGFESSVPGLHFLGAPAARSFGPLMRFVAGTDFASAALRRRVLGQI